MTDTRKITGSMSDWVDSQIQAGRFADENQAIEAGWVALADRDAKISNLNSLIQQGLDDVEAGRTYEYANADEAINDIMGSGT